MENVIIIAIIVVIAGIGVYSTVKHFKGQGGCCGGSAYKPKKKKLHRVIAQKKFKVEGMRCKHCKNRIEEIVNDIKGVSGRVDLKREELLVSYSENVEDALIKKRIEKAGYVIKELSK